MNPYYDPSRSHHRPEGFQNRHGDFEPKSLAEVLRWKWRAARDGLPPAPQTPTPCVTPDLTFLTRNASAAADMRPCVTWVGHATVLAQLGGVTLLTDPMFSERASPLRFAGPKRHVAPGIALIDLPHIDLVLISHNHYDHLDAPTVEFLARQPRGSPLFVVPLGLQTWFAARGISQVVELDWFDRHRLDTARCAVEVMLCPAQHWSARGLGDRMQTLWGGFAVFASDCHLFFAGDTGYSRDFKDLREHLAAEQTSDLGGGFDIALLPIGAYEPRWFILNQHVNVAEAIKIHQELGAKRSLGVHWGTFELTDEALDEPPRVLERERRVAGIAPDDFFVLAVGETREIPRRMARA
jgi:N-acyl-phosphatidylethanolamine-hydrolysing phospholipase D